MQLSSKIRVRRIAAKVALGCCQSQFFIDFGTILEGSGIAFFVCWGLGNGSKFHDFQMLSRSLSRAVLGGDNGISGALQPSLLKDSKLAQPDN